MSSKYLVEKSEGVYYVYEDTPEYGKSLVHATPLKEDLKKFDPELFKLQEGLEKDELSAAKKNKRVWDPDRHLEEVCNLYRKWAGWDEDELITEDHFKNQDWRLRKMSALKNTPVSKIKEGLLNQRIQYK